MNKTHNCVDKQEASREPKFNTKDQSWAKEKLGNVSLSIEFWVPPLTTKRQKKHIIHKKYQRWPRWWRGTSSQHPLPHSIILRQCALPIGTTHTIKYLSWSLKSTRGWHSTKQPIWTSPYANTTWLWSIFINIFVQDVIKHSDLSRICTYCRRAEKVWSVTFIVLF